MNNQPNAEELLKEAQTRIIELCQFIQNNYASPTWVNNEALRRGLFVAAQIEDYFNSRESSSTVTAPLEWEQAIQKSIENMGYKTPEEWSRDAIESGVDLMSRIEKIHNMYKEAALLFMRSHTNHALANFTENHATQIISPEK